MCSLTANLHATWATNTLTVPAGPGPERRLESASCRLNLKNIFVSYSTTVLQYLGLCKCSDEDWFRVGLAAPQVGHTIAFWNKDGRMDTMDTTEMTDWNHRYGPAFRNDRLHAYFRTFMCDKTKLWTPKTRFSSFLCRCGAIQPSPCWRKRSRCVWGGHSGCVTTHGQACHVFAMAVLILSSWNMIDWRCILAGWMILPPTRDWLKRQASIVLSLLQVVMHLAPKPQQWKIAFKCWTHHALEPYKN